MGSSGSVTSTEAAFRECDRYLYLVDLAQVHVAIGLVRTQVAVGAIDQGSPCIHFLSMFTLVAGSSLCSTCICVQIYIGVAVSTRLLMRNCKHLGIFITALILWSRQTFLPGRGRAYTLSQAQPTDALRPELLFRS